MRKTIKRLEKMVCHAIGRCRICARNHKMPIFGSEENQHALIEIMNLRLIILNTVCVDCIEKFEQVVKRKDACERCTSTDCDPQNPAPHLYQNNSIERHNVTAVRPNLHFYMETDEDKFAESASSHENARLLHQENFECSEKTVTHQIQKDQCTTPQTTSSSNGKTKNTEIPKKVRAKSRVQCRLCCDYCEKIFTHSGDLKRHNRKHTGEKPYECTECRKKFSQLSNLSRHRLVHSGERPFACAQCGQSYSRKGRLVNHIGRQLCRRNHPRSCKLDADAWKIKQCN